ncbi:MAG: hypothetical protein JXQ65_16660 [Candidatus Marinimicrobia bacterium]|nr:hypothetical protein [Candidatus Neomarinimicrobiota bacterium]
MDIIFQKFNLVYAEVKDGKIYFFAGIGLYDPNFLDLSQINLVEKTAPSLLLINYDDNKKLSIEAPRNVIDQMKEYFRQK